MKTLLINLALYIASSYVTYGQVNLVEKEIDWAGIELQNSDSLVSSLIQMRTDLNKEPQGYLDMQKSHSLN